MCPCNLLVLCVYDIITTVTNQFSMLRNHEHGIRGVWLFIFLLWIFACVSLQKLFLALDFTSYQKREEQEFLSSVSSCIQGCYHYIGNVPIKGKINIGNPITVVVFLNFVNEILWIFNYLVSHVYDIRTDVTNHCILLNKCERGVKGIIFLISRCVSL